VLNAFASSHVYTALLLQKIAKLEPRLAEQVVVREHIADLVDLSESANASRAMENISINICRISKANEKLRIVRDENHALRSEVILPSHDHSSQPTDTAGMQYAELICKSNVLGEELIRAHQQISGISGQIPYTVPGLYHAIVRALLPDIEKSVEDQSALKLGTAFENASDLLNARTDRVALKKIHKLLAYRAV